MIAILKRELKAYFTSVIGWIFMAAFFFVFNLYFVANNLIYGTPYLSYSLSKPVSCENVLRVSDPSSLVITITFPNLSRPDICSFNMLSCVPTERQPQIAVKTMILHVLSTISVFAIFQMIIYHPYGL